MNKRHGMLGGILLLCIAVVYCSLQNSFAPPLIRSSLHKFGGFRGSRITEETRLYDAKINEQHRFWAELESKLRNLEVHPLVPTQAPLLPIANSIFFPQDSKILTKHKIHISPFNSEYIGNNGRKTIPNKRQLMNPYLSAELLNGQNYLLTENDRPVLLKKIMNGTAISYGCGEEVLANLESPTDISGVFVASGKDVPLINIKWKKAKKMSAIISKTCKNPVPNSVEMNRVNYKIDSISGFFSTVTYSGPKDVEQGKDYIQYINLNSECSNLYSGERYHAEGSNVSAVEKLFGMLEVREGTMREKWIVFQFYDIESAGYAVIPFDSSNRLMPSDVQKEFIEGC